MKNPFDDFNKFSDASKEMCNKYANVLPKELIELWRKYGFGSFYGGYLKMVSPDDYKALVEETYFRGKTAIPIFVTAFGDVIVWEDGKYIRMIKYKDGGFRGMASGFDFFLEDVQNGLFDDNFFEITEYNDAVAFLGEIGFDECFGYVPLLGLGGNKRVDNLEKAKIREHIEIISQLIGKIGM